MNPFSLREALLARHAQHVVLIHFPIALFLAAIFKSGPPATACVSVMPTRSVPAQVRLARPLLSG